VRWGAAFLARFGPAHGGVLRRAGVGAGRLGRGGAALRGAGWAAWHGSGRVPGLSPPAFLALGCGVRKTGVWGPGRRGVGSGRLSSGPRDAVLRHWGGHPPALGTISAANRVENLDLPGARVGRGVACGNLRDGRESWNTGKRLCVGAVDVRGGRPRTSVKPKAPYRLCFTKYRSSIQKSKASGGNSWAHRAF